MKFDSEVFCDAVEAYQVGKKILPECGNLTKTQFQILISGLVDIWMKEHGYSSEDTIQMMDQIHTIMKAVHEQYGFFEEEEQDDE